jgi:hypothetical protein
MKGLDFPVSVSGSLSVAGDGNQDKFCEREV